MENLKKQRKSLRILFTRAVAILEKEIGDGQISRRNLNICLDNVEKKAEQISELDKEISDRMVAIEEINDEEFDTEFEGRIIYEEKLSQCRRTVEELLMPAMENSETDFNSVRSQGGTLKSKKYKLPKIELKKFGGDIKEWLAFWAQFEKIHKDEELADEDKFHYLRQSTEDKSKAREVVDSFPMTAANYKKVIEHMENRFGNKDMLVEVYVRELLNLVLSNALNPMRKIVVSSLYDKLETQLRALESLDVTRDKFAAILYPLVESSLSEELLRTWQRSRVVQVPVNGVVGIDRLTQLMLFLRGEVENEERILLARTGFAEHSKKNQIEKTNEIPTAVDLFVGSSSNARNCLFCGKSHFSSRCSIAKKMTVSERQKLIEERRACFTCLNQDHQMKDCTVKSKLRCYNCGGPHLKLMCSDNHRDDSKLSVTPIQEKQSVNQSEGKSTNLMVKESSESDFVVLCTFLIHIRNGPYFKTIRAAIDSGSQRTYLLKHVVKDLRLDKVGEETLYHELFGGTIVTQTHNRYKINAESLDRSFTISFDVLDQEQICRSVQKIPAGPWIEELTKNNIILSDVGNSQSEIDMLIGSNMAGKLLSGMYKFDRNTSFGQGIVAVNYGLGWTLMGELPSSKITTKSSLLVKDLFVNELDISDLWRLDVIGIADSAETKEKERCLESIEKSFKDSLTKNEEGRYEIKLPFIEGSPTLNDNQSLAVKRLKSLTKKLTREMREVYQKIFDDWETEGIIEKVSMEEINDIGHYLPHKAVYKPNSLTTPVRPVFDASARDKNLISLNKCLEKGPNLLEVIDAIVIRFRMRMFGILADIKKAFLQISIDPADRNHLRFLWWERNSDKNVLVYRHKRLVFGLTCSSFILGVVIKHILENAPLEFQATATQLQKSNYVDNCITSLDDEISVQKFKEESIHLMENGKFELRDWISNSPSSNDTFDKEVSVLGLIWNLSDDTLSCDIDKGITTDVPITKRMILSAAHQIFDPIGMTLPLMISPKLYLQECWELKVEWDDALPLDISKKFRKWSEQLAEVKRIKIPRWMGCTTENLKHCTLHVFSDASKLSYATAVFIRIETEGEIQVNLVQAKVRVAPLKKLSIPRLELLGCVIGVRLTNSVKNAMGMENIKCYHWTDAADALYWIQNEDCWGPFVSHRVSEIRTSTDKNCWRHVPGKKNPADILTRGITAKLLINSRWWEGPSWLKESESKWPNEIIKADESTLQSERKKRVICNWEVTLKKVDSSWLSTCKFSNDYQKMLRLTACILRFRNNSMVAKQDRVHGAYSAKELNMAEKRVVAMIQKDVFSENESDLRDKELFIDDDEVLRVKTKLTMRDDDDLFIAPAVLPGKHPIVTSLIKYYHRRYSHAGTQTIMSILRERFWIIRCRVAVKNVVNSCTTCKRYKGKTFKTKPTYLPLERVRDAAVFEATGVDLVGPLNLRGTGKAWIVLYTCAVYRAIHLELVSSMSTDSFIQSLRRFISRRGRPSTMWSDPGTNLVGTKNALAKVNWEKVGKIASDMEIHWNVNPPKAPWWGGWWERLIGIVKSVLKSSLGKSCLHYEEMLTVLCDIESIVNERPLTYLSEDTCDLKHLTPSSFLKDIQQSGVPDLDGIDAGYINRKGVVRQSLMQELRKRFRSEYLSQLLQESSSEEYRTIEKGEIVLIADDKIKNVNWPLARVIDLHPGKDKEVRVATVKTANGKLIRPVKGLVPLEIRSKEVSRPLKVNPPVAANDRPLEVNPSAAADNRSIAPNSTDSEIRMTRSGRQVKIPSRFGY